MADNHSSNGFYRNGKSQKVHDGTTRHHVPPTNPSPHPVFLSRIEEKHRVAYRLLFGRANTLLGATKILWREWWKSTTGKFPFIMRVEADRHEAYNLLFGGGNVGSFRHAFIILRHDWWTPLAFHCFSEEESFSPRKNNGFPRGKKAWGRKPRVTNPLEERIRRRSRSRKFS